MAKCIACNIDLKENETEICADCLYHAKLEVSNIKKDWHMNLQDVVGTDKLIGRASNSFNGTYYNNPRYFGLHFKQIQILYYALSLIAEEIGSLKKIKTIRTKMQIRKDKALKSAKNMNAILT